MNSGVVSSAVWQGLGALAMQIIVIAGLAALLDQITKSAPWRRTIWQICTLSLAVLMLSESTGIADRIGHRVKAERMLSQQVMMPVQPSSLQREASSQTAFPGLRDEFRMKVAQQAAINKGSELLQPAVSGGQNSATPAATAQAKLSSITIDPRAGAIVPPDDLGHFFGDSPAGFWLSLAWIGGALAFAIRVLFARLVLAFFRCRCRQISDPAVQERVETLARRLKLRRRVRLIESARLTGPIAFGILRPTVGLPRGFGQNFNRVQQEVILAHELAHLAAHDPGWHLLADLMSAMLWWHPVVWWSRKQLHVATETAADEASLLIANGPGVLAECLVELGGRLAQPRSLAWMGIEGSGFRSGLGRRVERLVNLKGRSWTSPSRIGCGFAKTIGPAALAIAAILCTAWTNPHIFNKGETMNTIPQTWKQIVAAVALAANVGTANNVAFAADSPRPPTAQNAAPLEKAKTNSAAETPPGFDPQLAERYGLTPSLNKNLSKAARGQAQDGKQMVRSKLEQTILNEVVYDGIPLSEVVKDLRDQSVKRDPEKRGINFLISNTAESLTGSAPIDPTTGAPLARSAPVDPNNVIIRFNLPLRNVRLKDVLDVLTKVADRPIYYSVENYGVVFGAGSPPLAEVPRDKSEESTPRYYRMDPKLLERYGLLRPGMTGPSDQPPAQPAQPPQKSGKLDAITLKEVQFDGLPLSEVLKFLYEESRKLDPEKQGINFIINPNRTAALETQGGGVDPITGQPLARPTVEAIDPANVIVGFNLPLRNVRLKDVLDAITKVAAHPIKYSVEDYGVVFFLDSTRSIGTLPSLTGYNPPHPGWIYGQQPLSQQTGALEVRTFRVNTNTFLRGLESAFGIVVAEADGKSGEGRLSKIDAIRMRQAEEELKIAKTQFEVGRIPQEIYNKAKYGLELLAAELVEKDKVVHDKASQARTTQQALRQLFSQLGVNMDDPSKTVFYNDLTGVLMARATTDDLKVIAAAIETLGGFTKVDARRLRAVSVFGSVGKPGALELPTDEKMDIIEAVSNAGGFGPTASKNKIELTRNGKTTRYRFDELMKETDSSKRVWLEPGDVIYVGESVL